MRTMSNSDENTNNNYKYERQHPIKTQNVGADD